MLKPKQYFLFSFLLLVYFTNGRALAEKPAKEPARCEWQNPHGAVVAPHPRGHLILFVNEWARFCCPDNALVLHATLHRSEQEAVEYLLEEKCRRREDGR